jgi:hypothetical protein
MFNGVAINWRVERAKVFFKSINMEPVDIGQRISMKRLDVPDNKGIVHGKNGLAE